MLNAIARFVPCHIYFHFQAFKTLRSFIERLEKFSEDPDIREEMGMFFCDPFVMPSTSKKLEEYIALGFLSIHAPICQLNNYLS